MRLEKLPAAMAKRLAELECPDFKTTPWVGGKKLSERRVAIVSSAGLVVRGDKVFRGRDADYRAIPSMTGANDLLCSHISINFDRTGFQEDWNVVFPLDRLNELAVEGRSAPSPRPITRSWARPTRCKWSKVPRKSPAGLRPTTSTRYC
jgi:D-proline reductase (dithiol) PrdB